MMSKAELVSLLRIYAGDDYKPEQEPLLESIVDDSIEDVRNARYPFGFSTASELSKQNDDVLLRYPGKIRTITEYRYDKIGKQGVKTFYEAGQTTTWESGGTPGSFLSGIIPVAKCVK